MKVCIAEKPSVAREIGAILGATARRDGYLEGNGYAVTWTFGHFFTLQTPDDYKPTWKRWDLSTLPMLPEKFDTKLISNKGVKKQFAVIKTLLKDAELVINCGDAGQEGELIQRWVLKHAKFKGKVLRLWISSLTAEAIKDGFQNLKDASHYDNLYYAGSSRAIGDWILGMNATRLYTLKFGGYKQVLSIGRVQTPTLAMLVERYLEIQNFVPKTFWELQTIYRDVSFNCTEGRFFEKEKAESLLQKVEGKPFTIVSFQKKKGKEQPPRLFDLTSLQVHCNKKFGYSADQTLKLVQSLYEKKLVTYPRVDTTYLPNDMYPKINGILSKMTNYSQFTQPLLGQKIRKSSKVFNDKKVTDHHAIIPTGIQQTLGTVEQNVYDSIARQFIAAFYPDCIVNNTTVIGESEGVQFKATGKEIVEEGWRVLFPKKKKKEENEDGEGKKEEEKILPVFVQGETGPHEPSLAEKQTKPPKNFTEATLLRAMETAGKKVDDEELRDLMKANGIGRPSTRANIIETLFKRKYIKRQRKLIIPTETGIQLIGIIKNDLLKSAELTGQWEKQLREIEKGEYSARHFIGNMKVMVHNLVNEVIRTQSHIRISAATAPSQTAAKPKKSKKKKVSVNELTCPKCRQGRLLKGKAAFGCSRYKEGCHFVLPFVFMEKKIPETQVVRLVNSGSSVQLKGFKKDGQKLTGKLILNDDNKLEFRQKPEVEKPAKKGTDQPAKDSVLCPKCGIGTLIKGKSAYGCSRWKFGCDFRFPFAEIREKANGKPLTKDLVLTIIKGE